MIKIPPKHSDEDPARLQGNERLKIDPELIAKYCEIRDNLSVRAKNILKYHDIWELYKFISWVEKYKDFSRLRQCGTKTAKEFTRIVEELRPYLDSTYKKEVSRVDNDRVIESMDVVSLQGVYDELQRGISNRAYHVLEQEGLLDISSFFPYLFSGDDVFKKFKNCGAETANELQHMCNNLCDYLHSLEPGSMSNMSISMSNLPFKGFLTYLEEDGKFICEYFDTYGHLPMFFLLEQYFTKSQRRSEKAFSLFWGLTDGNIKLFKDAKKIGYSQLGLKHLLSSIIANPHLNLKTLLECCDWKYYDILEKPYLIFERLDDIVEKEHLPNSFVIYVFLQFHRKRLYFYDKKNLSISDFYSEQYNIPILIDCEYAKLNIKKILIEIRRLKKSKTETDISIPILPFFVDNEEYWEEQPLLSDENRRILSSFFIDMLSDVVQIVDNNLIIKANVCDYQNLIYSIIFETRQRMHISDIFQQLQIRCQEEGWNLKYKDSSKIKRFLMADSRIIPIGKSSCWGLKEWGGMSGSIKEISIALLKQSDSPVKINDLAKGVLRHRPDSTEKSVVSVIWSCTYSGELIMFFDNLVGLPQKEYLETYVRFPQTFEEWIATFKKFVVNNKRFPRSGKTGYEGYLNRWYLKSKQLVELSPVEIIQFEELEKELALYPHNAKEEQFLLNCNLYKAFVNQHGRFLQRDDDVSLFNWFRGVRRKLSSKTLDTYSYNQQRYFKSLLQFLLEQPYKLDDNEYDKGGLDEKGQDNREFGDKDQNERGLDNNVNNKEEAVSSENFTSPEKGKKTLPIHLKPVPKKPIKKVPVPKISMSINPK